MGRKVTPGGLISVSNHTGMTILFSIPGNESFASQTLADLKTCYGGGTYGSGFTSVSGSTLALDPSDAHLSAALGSSQSGNQARAAAVNEDGTAVTAYNIPSSSAILVPRFR